MDDATRKAVEGCDVVRRGETISLGIPPADFARVKAALEAEGWVVEEQPCRRPNGDHRAWAERHCGPPR